MPSRVVVGGGAEAQRLARALLDRPGDIRLVVADEPTAADLREDGLSVDVLEPTEAAAWGGLAPAPTVVIVPLAEVANPAAVATACREALPAAYLVAIGDTVTDDVRTVVDRAIAERQLVRDWLVDRLVDPDFGRTLTLVRTLATLDDPVAVVTHDNPDPDAIASAIGVVALAAAVGTVAEPYYGGEITHQENRAFVNALDLILHRLDESTELEAFGGIVLVDHAHPGVNDQLPEETPIDAVIDHHPSHEEAEATFLDRRHDAGSTSTLVADHLLTAGVELDTTLATALWYGLQVDTNGFRRGVSPIDFEIAARIHHVIDTSILDRIEEPRMTATTLDTIGLAIRNRDVRDHVLVSDVGEITDRDALAQAADDLIEMAGIETACVLGSIDDTVYVSARTSDDRVDLGDAIRWAFGQIGNAGGHDDMAGAQLSLGALLIGDDDDPVEAREALADQFFEAIEIARRPLSSGHLIGDHGD
ncbi:MAG: DHH family phosphoesterase [Halobacteriota archaeon]